MQPLATSFSFGKRKFHIPWPSGQGPPSAPQTQVLALSGQLKSKKARGQFSPEIVLMEDLNIEI